MINEDKVILMTKMQAYEDKQGKKDIAIANYFRGDYIGRQMLISGVTMTIALLIVYAAHIFYDFEAFMKGLYELDLVPYLQELLTNYVYIVGGFVLITYLVYSIRYRHAKKELKKYYDQLKELGHMYQSEE